MKNLSLLFVFVLALFAGCKKEADTVEKILTFEIKKEQSFTAPKIFISPSIPLDTFPVSGVASDAEADFQRNGTSTNLVKNITLQELILTMPDNSVEDFSFLQSLDVYIAMPDGSSPVLMAYNHNITTSVGKKLVFTPTTTAMDKYVKAGNYMLKLVNPKVVRTVQTDLNITARLTFTVTANPLK